MTVAPLTTGESNLNSPSSFIVSVPSSTSLNNSQQPNDESTPVIVSKSVLKRDNSSNDNQLMKNSKKSNIKIDFLKIPKKKRHVKSVIFNEQVRVKSRTPTPKKTWYEKGDDDELSNISSESDGDEEMDDYEQQQETESGVIYHRPVNGNYSMNSTPTAATPWYRYSDPTSSYPLSEDMNDDTSASPYRTTYLNDSVPKTGNLNNGMNPIPVTGNHLKVSSKPHHSPFSTQHSLPNTNAVLVEHRASKSTTPYYAFTRRTVSDAQ
ncbi:unnamed protein product [Didymodactylos carnosus]|uniref:Uncharacterized protein n=1 Tax=Didymodactylos carnosus TaxID=1234261 RepID=A0A813Z190_9BILA|nr:unnamed protein product [Didymodactylos carnosus]CAF1009860.1 unnamed protein product [Didymodactylos carnosus]CAF3676953.1 unnamed protein product [Didymodactylos carnosus]CAF3778706.1 unnamed protein product [Didymodactylos carnosus]